MTWKNFVLFGFFSLFLSSILFFSSNGEADSKANLSDYKNWILQKMNKLSPIGKVYIADAQESYDEATDRYNNIAKSAFNVAFDKSEKPLFHGKYARSQTLSVLLSIAWWESRFRRDIDLNLGKKARGDHGKSWCLMQVQLGNPVNNTTPFKISLLDNGLFKLSPDVGWSGQDLVQDRGKCFRSALHMIRNSFNACSKLQVLDRLGVYTSKLGCTENQAESRARIGTAIQWLAYSPPPMTDAEIFATLNSGNSNSTFVSTSSDSKTRTLVTQDNGPRSVRQ